MSKRRWNRSISLLMITFIAAAVFAMTGVTAVAENLSSINVTIPQNLLLANATYTEAVYHAPGTITVDENVCVVESIRLTSPDGSALTDGRRLSHREEYSFMMVLAAKTGDRFDPSASVTVNGDHHVNHVNRFIEEDYQKLQIEWKFEPVVYGALSVFSLTGVPGAEPGNAALPYSYTHTEDGRDHYKVTGKWYRYNASSRSYEPMASADRFDENGSYQLELHLEAMPGYTLSEYTQIMVNDQLAAADLTGESELTCRFYDSLGASIAIHELYLTVPQPAPGQKFSDAVPVRLTVPADSHYTVQGHWTDENGNTAGTFTRGKDYDLNVIAYANDGYHFADNVMFEINNDAEHLYYPGKGKTASASVRMSLKYPIDEVVLLDVPKAEIGQKLRSGHFAIKVPAGAKYEVTAYWIDEHNNPVGSETVQAGKKYLLELSMRAKDGYQFAKEYLLKINGIDHLCYGNDTSALYVMEHSFLKQIHRAEVTGVAEPVAGQAPDTSSLKPAEPAKYTIVHAEWYDQADRMPAVTFQKGHAYELLVTVEAKPGYEFIPFVPWTLDSEKGFGGEFAASSFTLYGQYSFETVIPEIRLGQLPSFKAGERASTEIAVPSNAHYSVDATWFVWNDQTKKTDVFSGIFEQGKTYQLSIGLYSHPGYRFAKGRTAFYLNNVLNSDLLLHTNHAFYNVDFPSSTAKVIQRVELSIPEPVPGHHFSVPPQIKLVPGANYGEDSDDRPAWIVGDVHEWVPFESYFAPNRHYGARFALAAKEGYVFAKDLLVVVNGVILPAEAFQFFNAHEMKGTYFFDMVCQHIYQNGRCIGCHAADPAASLPKTGDSSRLALWFALLFISGGAVIRLTIANRKKQA